ncbi:MAG: fumarylacetoacetate hydrolase family protein [Dongiaceae bacterium]
MKLATLREGGRDGTLIVIDQFGDRGVKVPDIAPTLQAALDDWAHKESQLRSVYRLLNQGKAPEAFALNIQQLAASLPRAYQFLDGSAYLPHVERVRKARGADMPPSMLTDPLMYQGVSDHFLAPTDPITIISEEHGADFEAEVAVITDDVPMGVNPEIAREHIKLICLINDVSLRYLAPDELAKGFGFLHAKPASAISPSIITPDELGEAWDGGKVLLPVTVKWNGEIFGQPNAGKDMQFDFGQLIAHAAKTRDLKAGTLIGGGTVSNADMSHGFACIAEKRIVEKLEKGKAETGFLKAGDKVRIEMLDESGHSVFGPIDQRVRLYQRVEDAA